jgi:transposase
MSSVGDSRFKQRAVIEFLVHENQSVVNIHKRFCAVYGSCAVDKNTVGRWAKRVKASGSAETELRDLPRAARPATANTPDSTSRIGGSQHDNWLLQLSKSTGRVVFNY